MKKQRQRRDIYKGRFDDGFNIDQDVDLAHLRDLMSREDIDGTDYNYYGLYVMNIIKIMLNSSKFRGYPDDLKEELREEAVYDMLRARTKFSGDRYPQPTAPFNYLYRIGFHSFQHVLAKYYQMQSKMVPASLVGNGSRLMDSDVEFSDDILDKAATNWEDIVLNLQD